MFDQRLYMLAAAATAAAAAISRAPFCWLARRSYIAPRKCAMRARVCVSNLCKYDAYFVQTTNAAAITGGFGIDVWIAGE